MDKPEIDTLAEVPQLKAIVESENFLKEINCVKKKIKKEKEKKKEEYREEDAKYNIELSVKLHLSYYLTKFETSFKKIESDTGIPENKIKEFFADFIKEKVFPI